MPRSDRSIVLPPGEGRAVSVRGNTAIFKATGESTEGAFSVTEWVAPPAADPGPPAHVHRDADEAFYVLDGEFAIQVGRHTIRASAGSFILVPRGQVHTYSKAGNLPGRLLVILCPAGLERYWQELAALSASGRAPDADTVRNLAGKYGMELA